MPVILYGKYAPFDYIESGVGKLLEATDDLGAVPAV